MELAALIGDVDAIVFTAGSNGGSRATTKAIKGDGVRKAVDASQIAGVERFTLVSGALARAGEEGGRSGAQS